MKIAIISDIHSNLYALMEVLADIDNEKVSQIICLGDLVGYGCHPNEVIALIKQRDILCLKGNYDASVVDNAYSYIRNTDLNSFSLPWTYEELRASNRFYLSSLPETMTLEFEGKKIKFVHGSPLKINEYLTEDNQNIDEIMANLEEDALVCAHTHIPYIKQFGSKLLVNDGSVGKPKNGQPDATYALLEIEKDQPIKAKIKNVPYEFTKIMKDMTMKRFPNRLISSYESGIE